MILAKEKKEEVSPSPKSKKGDFKINADEMLEAGLHFGHQASRCHPKMKPYIFGVRNTVHIIDLEKTAQKLEEALKLIQELVSEKKILMIVGTKVQAKDLVRKAAEECDLPYVSERWIGGTFTNFEIIKKRVDYFKDLERKKAAGEFEKYTKKEQMKLDEELGDLEIKFGGIKNLEKIPDVVFVLDMKKDKVAIIEARKKGIKIIAVADTNVDPDLADYPIPASDDSITSIKYTLEKVKEAVSKAKK
jgi:small subunit ribosomal protein S2